MELLILVYLAEWVLRLLRLVLLAAVALVHLAVALLGLGVRVVAAVAPPAGRLLAWGLTDAGPAGARRAGRGLAWTARRSAHVGRTRVGPALVAGCVWLGEHVLDAADAGWQLARGPARDLVGRLVRVVRGRRPAAGV